MKRIDFIVELIKGYDTVADIGTDHGLVLKKAFNLGYIKKGYATDINPGPLKSSQKTLTGYPVEFYLSDGFKGLKKPFDLAVICGMGAYLIADILKDAPDNAHFLLGAHDNLEFLRAYLSKNNFEIFDEYVMLDKFYYVFLKVRSGKMELTEEALYTGSYLRDKITSLPYFKHQMDHFKNLSLKAKGENKVKYEKIFTYFKNAYEHSSSLK
ncbi:SAM-dependent methyltransferase [Acholeplasma equirhinis]|uniref:tRNA (adenine(22)-N(1))-methyltransferase n=1 Tax=Acholeplasma equirhinis TaxID=555393 RepID=UPI00197A7466|nr:class I SAM-dependent methyltransferase [Acholeplasma equirhinis]MBN3490070.1 SAM-dependent methyltransferase [Acholeplasma equirhinis]